MEQTIATEEQVAPVRRLRVGWALGGVSVLAIVGVIAAAVALLSQGPSAISTREHASSPLYTRDELTVIRLVEEGVLPRVVLTWEPFRTKQLVNEGLLPREALEPGVTSIPPLYCEEEEAVMAAVAARVIPREVLEGEPFRTKRLINQGLIPRASAPPC